LSPETPRTQEKFKPSGANELKEKSEFSVKARTSLRDQDFVQLAHPLSSAQDNAQDKMQRLEGQ
jgi:hypothetical protein